MRAVVVAPTRALYLQHRAEIYESLARANDAIADYRAALKLRPTLKAAQDCLARPGAEP